MKSIIRNIKNFSLIAFFLLIGRILYLVIASNIHNYSDKIWQPYQQGDSLVFFNNKGDIIRWGISQIDTRSNPSDPLLLLNHRIYSTVVSTMSNFDAIIHIREEEGIKTIYFEPRFRRGSIKVIEDKKNHTNLDSIKYNQMDLFKITPHQTDLRIEPYQKTIYWSSQYGFIKIFYSDGVVWELKSLSRNGQIIYDHNN